MLSLALSSVVFCSQYVALQCHFRSHKRGGGRSPADRGRIAVSNVDVDRETVIL